MDSWRGCYRYQKLGCHRSPKARATTPTMTSQILRQRTRDGATSKLLRTRPKSSATYMGQCRTCIRPATSSVNRHCTTSISMPYKTTRTLLVLGRPQVQLQKAPGISRQDKSEQRCQSSSLPNGTLLSGQGLTSIKPQVATGERKKRSTAMLGLHTTTS